jgi:hypothetical protein
MFSSSLPLLVCRMAHVLFVLFALFHIFTRFKCMSNMEGVLLEAGTAYLLWVPGFTPVFLVEFSFLCCVVHSWFVCLHPVFCVPNVASISGLPILDLFVFILCFVCPMLPVSLDCPFLICLSSSCVLCAQCCQYLWIAHSWFVCFHPVFCVSKAMKIYIPCGLLKMYLQLLCHMKISLEHDQYSEKKRNRHHV